jgi:Protein of unknown function (DUF3060)
MNRRVTARIFVICLAGAAACNTATPLPPVVQGGWVHYTTSRTTQNIPCGDMPIQLEGNHTDLTLTGYCRYVRITGEHNDIRIQIAPGGTIEIAGQHNDVWWQQVGPGPRPNLVNSGSSNTFHREQG